MIVLAAQIELRLDGCFSLKEKRHLLRGLLQKIRQTYSVAASEVADMDLWNSAAIGISVVSNDAGHAESILSQVIRAVEEHPAIEMEAVQKESLRF